MDLPKPPEDLRTLLDRAAIADLRHAYAHGVDRRDWALYRSIFADKVMFDFTSWAGICREIDADEWVEMVKATLGPFDATTHAFSNLLITVDGDEASCITTMSARHVLGDEWQILGGYYVDKLRRTANGWKIHACALMITWEEGDRGLFERAAVLGARARKDIGTEGI